MRLFIVALMLLLTGCDSSTEFKMAPVSGTITMDGKPLIGAEVVFAPMEVLNQAEVGPVSIGTTDDTGKFTLKTPKGVDGAVIAKHKVSVSFGEIDEAAAAAIVDKAVQKNRGMSENEMLALERKARQSMKNSKSIPESYNRKTNLKIEILGPTENADFDLKSDGS